MATERGAAAGNAAERVPNARVYECDGRHASPGPGRTPRPFSAVPDERRGGAHRRERQGLVHRSARPRRGRVHDPHAAAAHGEGAARGAEMWGRGARSTAEPSRHVGRRTSDRCRGRTVRARALSRLCERAGIFYRSYHSSSSPLPLYRDVTGDDEADPGGARMTTRWCYRAPRLPQLRGDGTSNS